MRPPIVVSNTKGRFLDVIGSLAVSDLQRVSDAIRRYLGDGARAPSAASVE